MENYCRDMKKKNEWWINNSFKPMVIYQLAVPWQFEKKLIQYDIKVLFYVQILVKVTHKAMMYQNLMKPKTIKRIKQFHLIIIHDVVPILSNYPSTERRWFKTCILSICNLRHTQDSFWIVWKKMKRYWKQLEGVWEAAWRIKGRLEGRENESRAGKWQFK